MVLVYQAIHAALLPVRLHDLPNLVGPFLDHIGHRNETKRPKQIELFRGNRHDDPARVPAEAA
jgi:hypothetical protein